MRLWAAAMLLMVGPAGAADRVVSLNLCTDQWLVLLAPEKIAALSPLARDPALSAVAVQAADLPSVRASAEAVMALHPDLVLGARFGAQAALAMLERAGIRVERLDMPVDFPGISAGLRATAALLDVPERAEPLIAAMPAALPRPTPARTAVVWQARGWTSGRDGLMDAVLQAGGLINLGSGGRLGLEALARLQPDILIIPENTAGESLATAMLAHPATARLPVIYLPTHMTICPTPAAAEVAALLAR